MGSIHVLSTMCLPDSGLDEMRSVSPQLVVTQYPAASVGEVPDELWKRIEILYTDSVIPRPSDAPNLRWIQLDTAGVNQVLDTSVWSSDIIVTTIKGIAPPTMAEFSIMMMLALTYRLPRILDHQDRCEYPCLEVRRERFTPPRELRGSTVGIIGYGNIGREIGRICHAFGMRVLGVRRGTETKPATYGAPELTDRPSAEADQLYTPDQLLEMLPECDYVVLSVPRTPDTYHMIDEAALRAMKPTAILVNVARGGVVDEAALISALQLGWIEAAAVDVCEEEPLDDKSTLYALDNLVVSPHVAGFTPCFLDRFKELFLGNLQRYINGEALLNQVDRERGY